MRYKTKKTRVCADCIHYAACTAWNVGSLAETDASNCALFVNSSDVAPVVHGRWFSNEDDKWACSICYAVAIENPRNPDYQFISPCCPNCGAKMDEKDGTENG